MYATACAGGGLINPRSQTLVPKINLELLGWLRPVLDRKADNSVRLRPSVPTARSLSRKSERLQRSSRKGETRG